MRRCLSCGGRFEEPRRVCPVDGDVLCRKAGHHGQGRTLEGPLPARAPDRRRGNGSGVRGHGPSTPGPRLRQASEIDRRSTTQLREALSPGGEVLERATHPGDVRFLEFRQCQGDPPTSSWSACSVRPSASFGAPGSSPLLSVFVHLMQRGVRGPRRGARAAASCIAISSLRTSFCTASTKNRSLVKILDFGIAKFLAGSAKGSTLSGEMIGTLLYMAPEQSSGRKVTPATDVYSLGVVIFEALAGRHPFDARSAAELIWLQASAPAPALSSTSGRIFHPRARRPGRPAVSRRSRRTATPTRASSPGRAMTVSRPSRSRTMR